MSVTKVISLFTMEKSKSKDSIDLTKLANLVTQNSLAYSFVFQKEDGTEVKVGNDEPSFKILIKNKAGYDACLSLHELLIAEAFIAKNIDVEGDLIKAYLNFVNILNDHHIILKTWRFLKPLLVGRQKCNPQWVAKHYDSHNLQLLCIENKYNTYTPGIYQHDDEDMETAAERKLAATFEALDLKAGDHLLDIGCGWGGFLRYVVAREINCTGITLSKHQYEYVQQLIATQGFSNAQVQYQDFFSYQSPKKYDAISIMGVMEELSDYKKVMNKLHTLVKPGGKIYLDFASNKKSFVTQSFVTKYVWPGTFRLVYMPEFITAVKDSMFEIQAIYNDRHNYYLWSKKVYEKSLQNKEAFIAQSDETQWRIFLILYAGTAAGMINPEYFSTAYRVVLQLPADHQAL